MNNLVDIQFKGLTTSPSDYACSDGELAICHNLENVNGELRPIMQPKLAFTLPSGSKMLYVHRTDRGSNAIIKCLSEEGLPTLKFADLGDLLSGEYTLRYIQDVTIDVESIKKIKSVGNILIFVSDSDVEYFRYGDNMYDSLGGGVPSLPRMSFGLCSYTSNSVPEYLKALKGAEMVSAMFTSTDRIGVTMSKFGDNWTFNSSQDADTAFNHYVACLNKCVADAKDYGAFTQPFFVRYAYRLYDGSVLYSSPSLLMIPCTGLPAQIIARATQDSSKLYLGSDTSCLWSFLTYNVIDGIPGPEWDELIQSIDVFVSRPIYTYDSDPKRPNASIHLFFPSSFDESMQGINVASLEGFDNEGCVDISGQLRRKVNKIPFSEENSACFASFFPWNMTNRNLSIKYSDFSKALENVTTFYHVGTITLAELRSCDPSKFRYINIERGVMSTLETRETLKEDYLSNYALVGGGLESYNRRVLRYGYDREQKTKYSLTSLVAYEHDSTYGLESDCYVHLDKEGKEYVVPLGKTPLLNPQRGGWIFYPDPYATKLSFRSANSNTEVLLKRHDFLQGAYWVSPEPTNTYGEISAAYVFDYSSFTTSTSLKTPTSTRIPSLGTVLMSEANNPFVFPSGLSATTGNGNIVALAATTLPISEGQQGQFPVMAFTDEGIWALEISNDGSMHASNPMLRDVLTDAESLCVIDDGVVYATDEGLRLLRGKTSVLITDVLKDALAGGTVLPSPAIRTLLHNSALYTPPETGEPIVWSCGCDVMFSSVHRRLYVCPRQEGWPRNTVLCYSLDTGAWSSALFPYGDAVAHYPTTYVQRSARVYDLDAKADGPTNDAVVLTRPMKAGHRDVPKTLMEVAVRGNFNTNASARNAKGEWSVSSEVNLALYGSNNLKDWFVVGSSKSAHLSGCVGTPYKYFRLLVMAPLGLYENKSLAA